jgi:hypothetical protein
MPGRAVAYLLDSADDRLWTAFEGLARHRVADRERQTQDRYVDVLASQKTLSEERSQQPYVPHRFHLAIRMAD